MMAEADLKHQNVTAEFSQPAWTILLTRNSTSSWRNPFQRMFTKSPSVSSLLKLVLESSLFP